MKFGRHLFNLGTAILLGLASAPASAQDFPTRPIRLVVPYAAGGGNDVMARTVGQGMADVLKQPVLIENKPGAGGSIGIMSVIQSPADGYSIVMGGIGSMVLRAAVEGDRMPFDPHSDIAPIVLVAKASPVLVVQRSLNVSTMDELVELAKTRRLTYGSAGIGSAMHMTGELFGQATGVELTHIPYSGQGPAMTGLLADNISFVFTDVPVALPYMVGEDVKIIAVAGKERAEQLPDVPTSAEAGYPEVVMENWYGLYAPKDTPAEIVKILNEAAVEALRLPEIQDIIKTKTALIPLGGDSEALRQQMIDDTTKWTPIAVKAASEN